MQFFVGTSGYSYREWKGKFYSEKLPEKEMLSFYAQRFSTVEINHTFRGMPSEQVLNAWLKAVPGSFRFALKAPAILTHRKRLKGTEEATERFVQAASVLKKRRGPLLFQLPPNFKKDIARLDAFLALLSKQLTAAFEFRHESWHDDEVYQCLRKYSCALCVADVDCSAVPQINPTTSWGYVRLRRRRYSDKALSKWINRMKEQEWREAYVYFKHEDSAAGPEYVARFLELAGMESGD